MKHLPSIKEKWEQIRELIDNPRTGLKESSDTNKTRMELLGMIEEDRHAIGEMLLEWVEKNTQSINDEECWISDFVDAEDIETFIKSELLK